MRAGYGKGIGYAMALVFVPVALAAVAVLPIIANYLLPVGALFVGAVSFGGLLWVLNWASRDHLILASVSKLAEEGNSLEGDRVAAPAVVPTPPRAMRASLPSSSSNFDARFALIDREGHRRYAQIIEGVFQIGKAKDTTTTDIAAFARAVLKEGAGGRFTRSDGSVHGILGYGGRAREAVAYELDRAVAARIGIAPQGRL